MDEIQCTPDLFLYLCCHAGYCNVKEKRKVENTAKMYCFVNVEDGSQIK